MDNLSREALAARLIAEALREAGHGEDDVLIHDMIEGETNLMIAAENAAIQAKIFERIADGIKETAAGLGERAARFFAKSEAIRSAIARAMDQAGVKTLRCDAVTLTLSDAPPKVMIADPDGLPDEFIRVKREADKTAVKEALKAGKTIPGATLSNGGATLIARWK